MRTVSDAEIVTQIIRKILSPVTETEERERRKNILPNKLPNLRSTRSAAFFYGVDGKAFKDIGIILCYDIEKPPFCLTFG